ncbi:MAG: hypothetical protein KDC34_19085 [Saprospiraceae bacterium]|nr:hypothetical protein [Saprospiraceae bacterium]
MTRISYIHGPGKYGIPADEFADRAKEIPQKNFIDYARMTKGEMRLALLHEQLAMLAAYYPEQKEFRKGRDMLKDALNKGIHKVGAFRFGVLGKELQKVARQMTKARKETRPANNKMVFGRSSIQGGGIGDLLVPQLDCESLMPDFSNWEPSQGGNWMDPYYDCLAENEMRMVLNNHLEKSSAHMLYEFVETSSVSPTATVSAKKVFHKTAVSKMNQSTNIDRDLIRLWMRNGVMRENSDQGIGPLHPEESLLIMQNEGYAHDVNDLPGVNGVGSVVAAIVAIIQVIAIAISAIVSLINGIKANNPATAAAFNDLIGVGSSAFGPNGIDWDAPVPGSNGGNGGEGNGGNGTGIIGTEEAILLGAGALGLYYLMD